MSTATKSRPKQSPLENAGPPSTPPTSPANGSAAPAKYQEFALRPARDTDNLSALLQTQLRRIEGMLPRHLTPERMLRVALTAVQTTPALFDCTAGSVIGCVTKAAQLGLDLDPSLGQAYLVPFNNNKTNRREAQLISGYRGMIALARRSGKVGLFFSHVVYEGDEFNVEYGSAPTVHHRPIGEHRGDMSKATHAYAVVSFPESGERDCEVMSRLEVLRIKARSKAGNSGPWQTDEGEMWRKTVIRRLAKRCPLSVEFAEAAGLGDEHEYATVEQTPASTLLPVGRTDLRRRPPRTVTEGPPAAESSHPGVDPLPGEANPPDAKPADDLADEIARDNERQAAEEESTGGSELFDEQGPHGERR
jgi:recombination protein RecT